MYQFDVDAIESPASTRAAAPPIAATDGERLMRFRRQRDEAALAEVVEAHAAMVWGVCSQVLRHRQDVEDAFQATFLILARKAKSIRAAESAAGWLYRVAFRTSLLVRSQQRRRAEQPLVDEPVAADDQLAGLARHEECLTLLEELHALPERYRQPLVLCYFEGKSRREAADELGVTAASVKGLLARGTRMLRTRMVRRGAALSTAMAAASAAMVSTPALAAPQLAGATAALATSFALKSTLKSIGGAAKTSAAVTLAEKGILAMTIAAVAKPAAVVLAVCLTTGMWAVAAEKPKGAGASAPAKPVKLAETAEPAAADADAKVTAEPVDVQPSRPAPTLVEPPLYQPPLPTPAAPPSPTWAAPPAHNPYANSPFADPQMALSDAFPPVAQPGDVESEASNDAVNLEIEYWNLKAAGLEKKAQVMEMKATMLEKSGQAPATEILGIEAEVQLTLAEVKLCQSNALKLKEATEQRDRRRDAGLSAPPLLQPATVANPIYFYGTPRAPVPARHHDPGQSPQPAPALPSNPQPASAAPTWNNNDTSEAPTPAPATTRPRTATLSAPPGWAVPQYSTPPSAPFVVVVESADELKRKFDAERAANPEMSDAHFLRTFVNDKLRELQANNAAAYSSPMPAPATYPAPSLVSSPSTGTYAAEVKLAQTTPFDEFTRLKMENAALKKMIEARTTTGWAPMPSPEELAKLREENAELKKQLEARQKGATD